MTKLAYQDGTPRFLLAGGLRLRWGVRRTGRLEKKGNRESELHGGTRIPRKALGPAATEAGLNLWTLTAAPKWTSCVTLSLSTSTSGAGSAAPERCDAWLYAAGVWSSSLLLPPKPGQAGFLSSSQADADLTILRTLNHEDLKNAVINFWMIVFIY